MGEQAVKALLDLIDCKVETPQRMFLPTELVVRESATPPNS